VNCRSVRFEAVFTPETKARGSVVGVNKVVGTDVGVKHCGYWANKPCKSGIGSGENRPSWSFTRYQVTEPRNSLVILSQNNQQMH
jgi:hypothetical protein